MALRIVIKLTLLFTLSYFASYSQDTSEVTYHILFDSGCHFIADKIDNKENKKIFGMSTQQKKYFPKKYLFIYDNNKVKVRVTKKEIYKLHFSNIHTVYWELKKSNRKPNIFLYQYINENSYYKYPVIIDYPPSPPYPGPVD